jgi:hypothetical protein
MRRTFCGTVLLVGALLAAGCDNDVDNPTTPTEPAPRVTDTFTGTIAVNGASTHTFTIAAAGRVEATLTEVTPDATVQVGLALGTWNGSNCFVLLPKDDALKGAVVPGQVSGPGTLCVRIYDPASRLTEPLNYTVTVLHP